MEHAYALPEVAHRPLRFTLCITRRCNLSCSYCYVGKRDVAMPMNVARKAVDLLFSRATPDERIEIGFFGGEPLLEFDLLRSITDLIENHPGYNRERIGLAVVTNGTVYSRDIADFLQEHHIDFCLSCDGPPHVQDTFRSFIGGRGTATIVEQTLRAAIQQLPCVLVNAVCHPRTLEFLPDTVDYFASLGLRQIYVNLDFTAAWSEADAGKLAAIYEQLADKYIDFYVRGDPRFISFIDSKITLLLRGGYQLLERCSMGRGELAVTPDGGIYPCERLIGGPEETLHRLGDVLSGFVPSQMSCRLAPGDKANAECLECGLRDYCMHWCGCSNYFMTGYYNRVGPILCASEKAAILAASRVLAFLEERLGPSFLHHLAGFGHLNAYLR